MSLQDSSKAPLNAYSFKPRTLQSIMSATTGPKGELPLQVNASFWSGVDIGSNGGDNNGRGRNGRGGGNNGDDGEAGAYDEFREPVYLFAALWAMKRATKKIDFDSLMQGNGSKR